ncbi:MAG: tRNA (adenosine(37)-N6)-threonylcarbamoyltransferase complex ATPase subunit type 1 TsaE [Bacteroidetes bacterium]|nr:tRNA (adenosine(37)-N6)-threonylcarbamoyltransferase complex ATPase subunit type 1 TsaE [Bacteroidota bacterium]
MQRIVTRNEEGTIAAGEALAAQLRSGDVVALYGDLGTGKTRFVKGLSRGLGVREHVTSPTFTIVNEHRDGRMPLFHFDCYRLRTPSELDEIGFEEYLDGGGVCVVEWAEMIEGRLPASRINIRITLGADEQERIITIERP